MANQMGLKMLEGLKPRHLLKTVHRCKAVPS